jgi:hypothetical protein
MRKIPADAFDYYFSLGPSRSYRAVAEHYSVTKRAVTNLAKREDWQHRLVEVENEARARADKKKVDSLEAVTDRHLKALRLVFGKGIEALRNMPIDTPADAMRAIALAIREERVALGEPSDRTAISVEDTIRSEYERWMVVDSTAKRRSGGELDNDEKIG